MGRRYCFVNTGISKWWETIF